jgi:hypothetical protein
MIERLLISSALILVGAGLFLLARGFICSSCGDT